MKLPRRFALSTLLLLMFVVAAVFGYAQWRRQWLNEEILAINHDGEAVLSTSLVTGFDFREPAKLSVDGSFWLQVVDKPLRLVVFKNQQGQYYFEGQEPKSVDEVKQELSSLQKRLKGVGVTNIACAIVFPRTDDGRQTLSEVKIESLGAETEKQY